MFSKTYSYFLKPLKKGNLKISQASIEIDGEIYKSLPIEVLITDSVSQPSDSVTQYYSDDDIELRALISKGSPYLNEPITIIYKLYYKAQINISDARDADPPNIKDIFLLNFKSRFDKYFNSESNKNPMPFILKNFNIDAFDACFL